MVKKKIKVIYIITKNDIGGAQKYVRELSENLDKEKFESVILTGGRGGLRWLSNAFRPYFLFINDFLAVIELFFIFRRERPDIIHLNSSKAGVIGALAVQLYELTLYPKPHTLNPRVIFTAHGWVFNPDNDLSFWSRRFYILLHKLAAHFQDKIINVSEYDRRLALKYKVALSEKLFTVYNGIDYQNLKFLARDSARKFLFSKFNPPAGGLNPAYKWVGSIGRLVPEKNYETLIKAAALIKNVYFFIIGSGPEHLKLRVKAEELKVSDRVFFFENIAPAAPYFKAFDIFVLSSIKEGLPYTMLEAMAAELPIVVTRIGGMTEIIEGRGLVMPPREPEELARAINYFLDSPQIAQESAKKTNDFLKNNLTLKRMIEETVKIYLS